MNVSIIIPVFSPDKSILRKVLGEIKNQKYKGEVEVIKVDERKGFSEQMNIGIGKSKNEILVMLPQDCIPGNANWLNNLVEPFKDEKVIASVSKIRLPEKLWGSMSLFARALNVKEKGTIVSLLDGKGGAYRRSTLEKIGLFDSKTFRTGGEDFDTYIKIREIGKIAYPDALINHMHPTTFIKRLRKTYQYSNAYGALVRIYKRKMYKWYLGFFNALPLFGIVPYVVSYPMKKGGLSLYVPYLLAGFFNHPFYFLGFWKGFSLEKQTV